MSDSQQTSSTGKALLQKEKEASNSPPKPPLTGKALLQKVKEAFSSFPSGNGSSMRLLFTQ